VSFVRRLTVTLLLGLLIAALLPPAPAAAHSGRPTLAAAPVGILEGPAAARPTILAPAPGRAEVPWLLLGVAAGFALTAVRPRPRRALALVLVVLLGVFAVEHAVHSVHHLGARDAAACVAAAVANHVQAALGGGEPALHAPVVLVRGVAEDADASPRSLSLGPDPARAPPATIA
jgi:hypothetical protein